MCWGRKRKTRHVLETARVNCSARGISSAIDPSSRAGEKEEMNRLFWLLHDRMGEIIDASLVLFFSFLCSFCFFCYLYFLCVSCSGKGKGIQLTVTVSSIAPPKLSFGHLRAGFLVSWNSSYLDLVELIYVWIWKASILLLLMIPRPFIRLKTISVSLLFYSLFT